MTRELNVDSGGTGLRADFFLAVDVPLPWPKPVFNHQLLAGVTELLDSYSVPVRLLASVPEDNDHLTVTSYQRKQKNYLGGSALYRSQNTFQSSDLLDVLEEILDGKNVEDLIEAAEEDEVRELWVCTQGSHDVCCGSEGTALSLDASKNLQGIKVRRVSHLGGHRFAPTAVTFPDGRMWSHLSMENLHEVLDGKPIEEKSNKLMRKFFELLKGKIKIIGVGGVDSGKAAYDKIACGADFIQLYTGMVFKGPNIAGIIKKDLKELLIRDGVKNYSEIIGNKISS